MSLYPLLACPRVAAHVRNVLRLNGNTLVEMLLNKVFRVSHI